MRKDVRIVVAGDAGVGKTTLITTLLREEFVDEVEHVLGEVTIPPNVTPEKVTTHIVDTSARPADAERTASELRRAHVVCLLYAVDAPETFASVQTRWLPLLRTLGVAAPVVLIGNKLDLRGTGVPAADASLEASIKPLLEEWKNIETCVECSAKTNVNVSEVFYFAQKAVLYPLAPLFDAGEATFNDKAEEAFKRIFKLCDLDKDMILNDDEINEFQKYCFNTTLQPQEIAGLKNVLSDIERDTVINNGITELGFLELNFLFLNRGRLETTWAVLRKFGYGDDLELTGEYLNPKLSVQGDQSAEISRSGFEFLVSLFNTCDKDADKALAEDELASVFETAPKNLWTALPLRRMASTNPAGHLTLRGFLGLWVLTAARDYKQAQQQFAYLGYRGSGPALVATKSRKEARAQGKIARGTVRALVIGAKGSGKTMMLRRLLGLPFESGYSSTDQEQLAVQTVKDAHSNDKYLILQEVPADDTKTVLSDSRQLVGADALVLLYDRSDPKSLAFIANIMESFIFPSTVELVPWIVLETKSDVVKVAQTHPLTAEALCKKLNVRAPVPVSFANDSCAEVYPLIVSAALETPQSGLPNRRGRGATGRSSSVLRVGLVTVAVVAVGAVSVAWYFNFSYQEFSENKYVVAAREALADARKRLTRA